LPPKPSAAEDLLAASKAARPVELSDDPVLAELERGDAAPLPAAVFPPREASRSKSGRPLVATLILALAGGGVYAAWMYQPGFRALVQPQIDRALALVGTAWQQKAVRPPAPMQVPAQTSAKPTPNTATSTASPANATRPNGVSAAGSPEVTPGLPATAPLATTPALASAPANTKPGSPTDSKKTEVAAASSDSGLPGDEGAIILSSKGAEKRLVLQVPPTLPIGARALGPQGTIVLKTVVDDSGKVESVLLIEGNPALADAAIHAVKQWRYRPYVRDGKRVPFQTVVLVDFQRP
jgi:TonB family protein